MLSNNGREYDLLRSATVRAADVHLSVVIPSYNTGEFVGDAIRSVLAQTMPKLEVIVVDDGSSDDSIERILGVDDLRLTCVRQRNRGLAGARNTGVLLSRAPLIGFLDSDDVWYPTKAEKQLTIMADAKISLTFSNSAYLTHDGAPNGQLLIAHNSSPSALDLTTRNSVGNGSTPIVRASCFAELGLFDEGLHNNFEDLEMWVRIAAHNGYKLRLIPEILTGYRVRRESLSLDFSNFLANGAKAITRFREYVPGFSETMAARCYAQQLRVASRKALSNGQVALSLALLKKAVRSSPSILIRDIRALPLVCIHAVAISLPPALRQATCRALVRKAGCVLARIHNASANVRPIASGTD